MTASTADTLVARSGRQGLAARLPLGPPDPGGPDGCQLVEPADTARSTSPARVLHLAERAEWERARAAGTYRGSTRGAGLDDVGFVHACTSARLPGVLTHFYADLPLEGHVLLVVDTADCEAHGSPVRWEAPTGAAGRFPHVHGPLPLAAVVGELPLQRDDDGAPVLPPPSDLEGLHVLEGPPNG